VSIPLPPIDLALLAGFVAVAFAFILIMGFARGRRTSGETAERKPNDLD
jgi:hypothetical protein